MVKALQYNRGKYKKSMSMSQHNISLEANYLLTMLHVPE